MPAESVGTSVEPEVPMASREVNSAVEQILRERARQYAQAERQDEPGATAEVLLFRLGEEHYAAELRLLQAVQRAKSLTPVPCTPPHVAGILNVRGEVVTVVDLTVALGLTRASERPESAEVLLMVLPRGRIGLLVDEVLGVHQLAVEHLDRSLSGREFAHGVAEARMVFVDLEQLLSGAHFNVLEEVS